MNDIERIVELRLRQNAELAERLLLSDVAGHLAALAASVASSLRNGGKVLLFGNGGSDTDASHLAGEFVGRFRGVRDGLAALSLGDQHAAMTAIANDFGFESVFARGIEAFGRPGDVAIGLSTSGTSANVVRGLVKAAELGLSTALFTGEKGEGTADVVIRVPSTETPRIQEATLLLGHTMCELVELELGLSGGASGCGV